MNTMLFEGGNVFKDIKSDPIKKEDIKPTLKEFFRELSRIFPKASTYFKDIKLAGSTGKKDVSGDIDLLLDEKSLKNVEDWNLSREEVHALYSEFKKKASSDTAAMRKAILTSIAEQIKANSNNIHVDTRQASQGTIFTQFPQYNSEGEKLDTWVQIDINTGNLSWLTFSYHSDSYPEGSNIKGAHRTELVSKLFSNKGYVFNHNNGVRVKETGEVVATTPEEVVEVLNKLYGFNIDIATLNNYEKLQKFLQDTLDDRELSQIYDLYLQTLDRKRLDIPLDLQNRWLDKQDELGLTGKYLPSSSKLYAFRDLD